MRVRVKDTATVHANTDKPSMFCGAVGTVIRDQSNLMGMSGVLVDIGGGLYRTRFTWDELDVIDDEVPAQPEPRQPQQRYVVERAERISASRVEVTARAANQCTFRAVLPLTWSVPVGAVITLAVEPITNNEGVTSE